MLILFMQGCNILGKLLTVPASTSHEHHRRAFYTSANKKMFSGRPSGRPVVHCLLVNNCFACRDKINQNRTENNVDEI